MHASRGHKVSEEPYLYDKRDLLRSLRVTYASAPHAPSCTARSWFPWLPHCRMPSIANTHTHFQSYTHVRIFGFTRSAVFCISLPSSVLAATCTQRSGLAASKAEDESPWERPPESEERRWVESGSGRGRRDSKCSKCQPHDTQYTDIYSARKPQKADRQTDTTP